MRKIVYQVKIKIKNANFSVDSVRKFVYTLVKQSERLLKIIIWNTKIRIRRGTMLKNFNDIRKEKKVSLVDLADLLEVRYQTVADKINGVSDFKFGEALLIKNEYFPEYDIEYLFEKEKERQTN
jgi:hypothetical protein